MGVGNDPRWRNVRCFDPFPFPECTQDQSDRIRELAESLDSHRKERQKAHPSLTLTNIYNVLDKLRSRIPLTKKDKEINEDGLCSVLLQLHDDLDAVVADAYGWPSNLPDEEILERLVALNAERAEEEKRGIIRWLRPEFQAPKDQKEEQGSLDGTVKSKPTKKKAGPKAKKQPWPKELVERVQSVRSALEAASGSATADEIAKMFSRAKRKDVAQILETLASLGQAQRLPEGTYTL
jgi:hypothetical protein